MLSNFIRCLLRKDSALIQFQMQQKLNNSRVSNCRYFDDMFTYHKQLLWSQQNCFDKPVLLHGVSQKNCQKMGNTKVRIPPLSIWCSLLYDIEINMVPHTLAIFFNILYSNNHYWFQTSENLSLHMFTMIYVIHEFRGH